MSKKKLREIILDTLDSLSNNKGVIQADPATATDEIMAAVQKAWFDERWRSMRSKRREHGYE